MKTFDYAYTSWPQISLITVTAEKQLIKCLRTQSGTIKSENGAWNSR
jgi:hypothetical protein